jgi:chromosome segregation ATPase
VRDQEQSDALNAIYEQFASLLPNEFILSNERTRSLPVRFTDLFEQLSSYVGTLSIIHDELDALKQILGEKQDELNRLQGDLADAVDTRVENMADSSDRSVDSDEEELGEILRLDSRTSSRQSMFSTTHGEKQQLIAQNELLSSLLADKEQELVGFQQAEKVHDEALRTMERLRASQQQMEIDRQTNEIHLNDMKNILDEKLRENSSLKKEKMFFIDQLAKYERDRQEQRTRHVSSTARDESTNGHVAF